MVYTKRILTYFAFILPLFVQGQTPIDISLSERMQDDKIARSLAILPVYTFQSTEIEPFTLFGIDDEKKEEQPRLIIKKMPDMTGMRDTGYTYIYFSGANNRNKSRVLFNADRKLQKVT